MLEMMPRRRRAIGVGLTIYGVMGLAAGALVLVATIGIAAGMRPALENVDRQRDAVVASLERGSASLEKTAALIDDFAGAVQNTSAIASEAANVSRRFADTLGRLATTFGSFSVLGNQPFGPLASDATQLAEQLRGIAIELDALGSRSASSAATSRRWRRTSGPRLPSSPPWLPSSRPSTSRKPPKPRSPGSWWAFWSSSAWLLVPAVVALVAGIALLRRRASGSA